MPFNQTSRVRSAIVDVAEKPFRLADYFSGLLMGSEPRPDRTPMQGSAIVRGTVAMVQARPALGDNEIRSIPIPRIAPTHLRLSWCENTKS